MLTASRYDITHVYLDNPGPLLPPPGQPGQGNYLVFWWKELALGHLVIEPGPTLTAVAYWAALTAAIQPAVQHYKSQQRSNAPEPAPQDQEHWRAWLGALLVAWLPVPPSQVPVSVIICTRNRAPQLRRCLQRLHMLPCAPTEIVVVDNAPTDVSTQQVAMEFAGVIYIHEPRGGLDIARNTGIMAARCPVVAFVDDDVVVHSLLLYRVWEAFQDPATAALTGLVLALALQTEAQVLFEQYWSFNRGYLDRCYSTAYLQAAPGQAPPVWEIGAGANMAFRKSIFKQVGYFDERLDVGAAGCSGDSEMWYRILAHGHTIRYVPRAIVYHEHRQAMAELQRQLYYYMRGHAAAALIQQEQQLQRGYARHLYLNMPRYYADLLRAGFPFFPRRGRTLWAELTGLVSGVIFYYRNRTSKPLR